MATAIARRSRKARKCDSCGKRTIRPGGMRLIHTTFKSDEFGDGAPYQSHECWGCAVQHGRGDLLTKPGRHTL